MFDLSEVAVRTALPKMPMHHILVNFTGAAYAAVVCAAIAMQCNGT